ncbi:MAG: hypothetical protein RIB65_14900 [Ilumatobacter fluminis]|uniref:hypothetical protein n=1 Tax=Ilumatobacter fluminis TaxID=467091 RepID=UPI0032ED8685
MTEPADNASDPADVEADAKARKAVAEAAKAERELADYESEAAAAARAAAHAKNAAEAEQARRTADVVVDPGLVRRQKEAELRKTATEAESAAAESRRKRIAALVPNLADVKPGELEVGGDRPLLSGGMARLALGQAAEKVSRAIERQIAGQTVSILVTSDPDLATADGIRLEVSQGLAGLTKAADDLLAELGGRPTTDDEIDGTTDEEITTKSVGGMEMVAGAVAAAIPGILSLLTAKRATTSGALELDQRAAVADVAGRLLGQQRTVRVDDFRPVPNGSIADADRTLRERRSQLHTSKIGLEAKRTTTQIELTQATATAARAQQLFDESKPNDDDRRQRLDNLENALRAVALLSKRFEIASGQVGMIDELVAGIDEFITAIHATADGRARSLFVTAALYEQLHGGGSPFTHVAYVSAATGSLDQVTDDKPLWFDDKFSVIATANITYMLIDTHGVVKSAGVKTGVSKADGTIGSSLSVSSVTVEDWAGSN